MYTCKNGTMDKCPEYLSVYVLRSTWFLGHIALCTCDVFCG